MTTTTSSTPGPGDGPVLYEAEARAVRRGVPDPGIRLDPVTRPTVALFFAALAVWVAATWMFFAGVSPWVTIPLHAAVTFVMFTVLHECTHHAAGRLDWVNTLFGRLSMVFVAAYGTFGMMKYVHLEHHRNTNESQDLDPDSWISHGPKWQMPLRWPLIDIGYVFFFVKKHFDFGALWRTVTLRNHDKAPIVLLDRGRALSQLAWFFTVLGVLGGLAAAGYWWQVLALYVIPQRIGVGLLGWWFDYLPHHGLKATSATNRFQATRVRVGMEWLLTPVLLYQNYHLVHHLHPSIPFYRYIRAWKTNEEAYLDQEVPIMTGWGRELTPAEYRAWRHLEASLLASGAQVGEHGHGRDTVHHLRVADVAPLTDDSAAITLDVPEALRETFAFTPGQHLPLRLDIDGRPVRRTYSICAAATSNVLRIAVKQIPGGVASTYLTTRLKAGDTLAVLPPGGSFTLDEPPTADAHHYVAVAAGSGTTPVISMVGTALNLNEDARFTLLYGNRSRASTMFRDELEMLARQFEGRLRIVHYLTEEPGEVRFTSDYESAVAGRLTPQRLAALLGGGLGPDGISGWYLCGPQEMVLHCRELLLEHGAKAAEVHLELFHATTTGAPGPVAPAGPVTVTAQVAGQVHSAQNLPTESVLETLLRNGVDAPYSCMGGACGTCKAKLVRGEGDPGLNFALTEADIAAGYILTCQTRPTSERFDVDYDA